MKGALLSGLVFPGLGQIAQKHYKRGTVIILTVLVSVVVVVVKAVEQALAILEKIYLEGGSVSISTIKDAATRASVSPDSFSYNIFLLLIIGCWLVSIVDAYLGGKGKDLEKHPD